MEYPHDVIKCFQKVCCFQISTNREIILKKTNTIKNGEKVPSVVIQPVTWWHAVALHSERSTQPSIISRGTGLFTIQAKASIGTLCEIANKGKWYTM